MSRTPLARLVLACAGLFLVSQAHAQTPPAAGDTVNPWKGSNDAPKGGAGDTVNPWNGATPPPTAAPGPKADKGAPAARAAAERARKPQPVRHRGHPAKSVSFDGPIAGSPSFRMLEGGVTRIFLEVSRKVDVSENKAKGRVVYHLKGAQAPTRTNRLPLLTGFFVTPVDRVELIEQADGVDLAIDLREAVEPKYEVIETPRGMLLQVDFPRSERAPADPDAASSPLEGQSGPTRSTATRRLESKGAAPHGDSD